jgi:hypothetical protein
MWREEVVTLFKVLSRYLTGGTEENHDNLRKVGVPAEIPTRHLPHRS